MFDPDRPDSPLLHAWRDDVSALLYAVVAADVPEPDPAALVSAGGCLRYLGDVVDIAFNGEEDARVGLIGRLLALAAATVDLRYPGLDPTTPQRRLERMLRRWEDERRRGAVRPRPRAQELETRVAMLGSAHAPVALIGVDVVAMPVAELVAVHVLAGTTSVEEGMRCVGETEPLVDAAAALLCEPRDERAAGVYEHAGATLAHVDHAAWQLEQLTRDSGGREDALWARALWLEIAAALVFGLDAYERRRDHGERWREVQQLAVEKMTVGRLRATPRAYDLHDALDLVRSSALAFVGAWLDEANGETGQVTAPLVAERLLDGAARAVLAAWAIGRRLDEESGAP